MTLVLKLDLNGQNVPPYQNKVSKAFKSYIPNGQTYTDSIKTLLCHITRAVNIFLVQIELMNKEKVVAGP